VPDAVGISGASMEPSLAHHSPPVDLVLVSAGTSPNQLCVKAQDVTVSLMLTMPN
jgi:hypothetical protein